ncbi:Cro/Cl family transcriptional regulator [Sporolactobacillus inulinus CASD]|uniref:Cro/Cl family transcriptional regulator n=2 Tax=Sporolactobacillus inulinus TaxID=2078 RepID=A0A0U1QN82_9BACL|nr:helix-turn-helix transcriptional regulator [Sporolactobacillus inulinus]KLI02261.1 Cro/Cl family transcriptional regulator [Sporolactobacillus inulinus CASD]GEB77393.1 transcriptional regulator [Sporolactobacillus inulinus]
MMNSVKHARMERGMTQVQLAEKTGVTRQTVSLIEKGKYNPTLKLCLSICYAVGKSLDQLFWVNEGEKREENYR